MKHASTKSAVKQAFREYERERKWRRSVEAVLLLLVVVPVVAFGIIMTVGWWN